MSYNNQIAPSISSPTGIDEAIESIRLSLSVLPWLERSFGRAWEFKETLGNGKISRVPKVFIGKNDSGEGEYYNVLPNDNFKAQSFIAVRGPEQWEEFNRFGGNMKVRELSVIFWVNLKQINPARDYIFIDELKTQVEQILKTHPSIKSLDKYYDERAESIFDGYDVNAEYGRYSLDDSKSQLLMYPYAGMRFDLTINYPEVC